MNANNVAFMDSATDFCAVMDVFDALMKLHRLSIALSASQEANLAAVMADLNTLQADAIQRMAHKEVA